MKISDYGAVKLIHGMALDNKSLVECVKAYQRFIYENQYDRVGSVGLYHAKLFCEFVIKQTNENK